MARVIEQRLDGGNDRAAGGWLQLADNCRNCIEDLIDAMVDRTGALIGFAAEKGRKTQTGAIPTYLAILTGGFFFLLLTLIIGMF